MKVFGLEWYKWIVSVLLIALGSGLGFLYQEIKDTGTSSITYTDTTFTRYVENQDKLLKAQKETIEEMLSSNKKVVAKLIRDENVQANKNAENLRLTLTTIEDLGQNERTEIRREIRALSAFSRKTRDLIIEFSARFDEGKRR